MKKNASALIAVLAISLSLWASNAEAWVWSQASLTAMEPEAVTKKQNDVIVESVYANATFRLSQVGQQLSFESSTGQKARIKNNAISWFSCDQRIFTPEGQLLCVDEEGYALYEFSKRRNFATNTNPVSTRFFAFDENARSTTVSMNPSGHWAIAYIGEQSNRLYVGRHGDWQQANTQLNWASNVDDILAVYPLTSDSHVVALYRYANNANKALNLHYFDRDEHFAGTLVQLSDDNFGLKPRLKVIQDQLFVSAENTTEGRRDTYQVALSSLPELAYHESEQSLQADSFDAMILGGVHLTRWTAEQSADTAQVNVKTDYRFNDSVLTSVALQGRWNQTRLALNFMQSQAQEDQNQLQREATSRLFGYVDLHDLVPWSTTLRLQLDLLSSGGVAEYTDSRGESSVSEFEADYEAYSLQFIGERGGFWGIEYSTVAIPGGFAFLDASGQADALAFDPDAELTKFMFIFGYDHASYAHRYELNYSGWFVNARLGLGSAEYAISAPIKEQIKQSTGATKVSDASTLMADLRLELGYNLQARSAWLGGLGGSLQAGIFAYGASFSADEKAEERRELNASASRQDRWFGPFVRVGLMF